MRTSLLIIFLIAVSPSLICQVCDSGTAIMELKGRNIKVPIVAGGTLWVGEEFSQKLTDTSGYSFPANSDRIILRGGGLIIAGLKNGKPIAATISGERLTPQSFKTDFYPGPLNDFGNPVAGNCSVYNKLWRVTRSEIDSHKVYAKRYQVETGGTIPIELIPAGIRQWPAGNNPFAIGANGNHLLADLLPWIDYDNDNSYDPRKGDYPDVHGDVSISTIYNAAAGNHSVTGGDPVKLEIRQEVYLYQDHTILGNTTFYNFKITNKGDRLDSCYLGLRAKMGFGVPVGMIRNDTERNCMIVNAAIPKGNIYPMVAILSLKSAKDYRYGVGGVVIDSQLQKNTIITSIPGIDDSNLYNFLSSGANVVGADSCKSSSPGDLLTGPCSWPKGKTQDLLFAVTSKTCSSYRNWECADESCITDEIDSIRNIIYDGNWTGIEYTSAEKKIIVYPNPSNQQIFISGKSSEIGKGKLRITDIGGRVLMQKLIDNNRAHPIDVSNLPQGIYLISLFRKEKLVGVTKMIIAR